MIERAKENGAQRYVRDEKAGQHGFRLDFFSRYVHCQRQISSALAAPSILPNVTKSVCEIFILNRRSMRWIAEDQAA